MHDVSFDFVNANISLPSLCNNPNGYLQFYTYISMHEQQKTNVSEIHSQGCIQDLNHKGAYLRFIKNTYFKVDPLTIIVDTADKPHVNTQLLQHQ